MYVELVLLIRQPRDHLTQLFVFFSIFLITITVSPQGRAIHSKTNRPL